MNETLKYCATCLFGLERLVGEEIDELGYKRTETIDGRVYFEGDVSAAARCNLWLRCAERVFICLGAFNAATFTELFDGTAALPWEDFIGVEDAFPVTGHSIKSKLFSVPDCQAICKKAIVKRLSEKYGVSWFEETKTKVRVEFFILEDKAVLMIDTSGNPLFKRGYREDAAEAPLRETLAASLVKLSRPRENVITWDPFCGSGTIAIEAALLMTNTAPGMNRRFAAEHYAWIPKEIWRSARKECEEKRHGTDFRAWASDISEECVALTKANAKRAGVAEYIKVFRKDALTIKAGGEDERFTLVCNPPYGERMGSIAEARELYRKLGKTLSGLVPPWQMYLLTSEEEFERLYGRRADKARKLYNGMIKCYLYQFFRKDAVPYTCGAHKGQKSFGSKNPAAEKSKPYSRKQYGGSDGNKTPPKETK